jgi:xanthine dehydrogenase YagS FAD-binding subunit
MHPFTYSSPEKVDDALTHAKNGGTVIAGGTTLIDLMKLNVLSPASLVDINKLGLSSIEKSGDLLKIGALVTNSDLAHNKIVLEDFPVLSQAILSGATAQLRNMATVGGNIMQRTRCYYFRDTATPCNKREPASGCAAIDGFNRIHAVLGGSDHCVATHGSDMCVALLALDANVILQGPNGTRSVPIEKFHLLPGATPEKETVLHPEELIVAVEVPYKPFSKQSLYLKVRDRASYAFALSSVAVALELSGNKITSCRLALGGVATKPWRVEAAEKVLNGNVMSESLFKKAAEAALAGARPLKYNKFKIELSKRTIVRALKTAGGLA